MTLTEIDHYCRQLPGCDVRYPFESSPDIRAWCIGKKMFAWCNTTAVPVVIQLKADPDLIPSLLTNYPAVSPGYHMNKRHWISVDASCCDREMQEQLLEDAHALVAAKLPRSDKLRLLG